VGRMLKLQKVGLLCGQNAEVAKREAHYVGRMLKLQRDRHNMWAEC